MINKEKTKFFQWDVNQKFVNVKGVRLDFIINEEVYEVFAVDGVVGIPDEWLQTAGKKRVYECYENGTLVARDYIVEPRPQPTGYVYTPTEKATFESLVQMVEKTLDDSTEKVENIVALLQKMAEEGDFDGKDGEDGFSPVIEVVPLDDGYKVIITSKEGENVFVINDGKDGKDGADGKDGKDGKDGRDGRDGKNGSDGKDGYTPIKGVDYFDGEDGFSPSATVERVEGGAVITITDKDGTTSAPVYDGQGGGGSGVDPVARAGVEEVKADLNVLPLPFSDTTNATNNNAVHAFSDFVIHMADTSKEVKLMRVLRKSGNVNAIQISVDGTLYLILNKAMASYSEPKYNTFNIDNIIYGYYVIDWDSLEVGKAYNSINSVLKQTFKKDYVETPKYDNVEVVLPSVINAVVGKEISLEYYNIVRCTDISEFQIDFSTTNAQIQNLGDRLRITPTTVGTTNETMSIYKNGVLIAKKTFSIKVVADNKPTIKALFLGDSMTNSAVYIAELINMLGNNKIVSYGTRQTTVSDSSDTSRVIHHEGRAGWSTSNYCNSASVGGITNPFYNNGFNFSYYMGNNPTFSDLTDVFILLGTNDGFGTDVETRMRTICNSIKSYNSSIRIHIMLPVPPVRDGYAYGTRNYMHYLTFKDYMLNTDKKYLASFENVSGYFIVPIHANLNCWYDFPQIEVDVNSRNPQKITVLNDNVHPSKYGYYRFADVIYCDIIANCV